MKKAFTMIELVFVLVVVGIITAMIAPNFQNTSLREAANQIISHIRYTQHLAMMDDKYDLNSSQWYRQRWQIAFSTASGTRSYYIFSDLPSSGKNAYDGNPDANNDYTKVEVARNTLDRFRYLIGVPNSNFANSSTERLTEDLNIGKKYGISQVNFSGGTRSTVKRILFDNLGRPYRGTGSSTATHPLNSPVDFIATTPIYIKLCTKDCIGDKKVASNNGEIVIKIEPETGYAHIL